MSENKGVAHEVVREAATVARDELEQLKDAFDFLDSQLAQTGRGMTSGAAGAPQGRQSGSRAGLKIAHERRTAGMQALDVLVSLIYDLSTVERRARQPQGRVWLAQPAGMEFVSRVFGTARRVCVELELESSRVRTEFASTAQAAGDPKALAVEARELIRHLRHDLRSWSLCRAE